MNQINVIVPRGTYFKRRDSILFHIELLNDQLCVCVTIVCLTNNKCRIAMFADFITFGILFNLYILNNCCIVSFDSAKWLYKFYANENGQFLNLSQW